MITFEFCSAQSVHSRSICGLVCGGGNCAGIIIMHYALCIMHYDYEVSHLLEVSVIRFNSNASRIYCDA